MNKTISLRILSVSIIFLSLLFITACSSNVDKRALNSDAESSNSASTVFLDNNGSDIKISNNNLKEVDIVATNYDFRQTGPQINKGDTVKIVFSVEEGTHSLTLSGYNVEISPTNVGQTQSVTFVADKSGTFEYHCNNYCGVGHKDMVGQIVVN